MTKRWTIKWVWACGLAAFLAAGAREGQTQSTAQPRAGQALGRLILAQGESVEVLRAGTAVWGPASTDVRYNSLYANDQVRTGARSKAVIQWTDKTTTPLGAHSYLQIVPRRDRKPGFNLFRGIMYFFHRDRPGEFDVTTPTISAVVRGTEFHLRVDEDGTTTLSVFEGEVEMVNQFGRLYLKSREEGVAAPGQGPVRSPALVTVNIIQWALYYPGVLDVSELQLAEAERKALADSLEAYGQGDLVAALVNYPAGREPASHEEKVYRAAVLLAVGQVEEAQRLLQSVEAAAGRDARVTRLGAAIQKVIAAVKVQDWPDGRGPELATEWLAESYYRQSRFELEAARAAARKAVEVSPGFAFGWARVAELEFSFGRTSRAKEAVERSLRLAPRNAEAVALKGFLLAAQNKVAEAQAVFDEAIALDGSLGNAWLGRGLCKIRRGLADEGRQDIQTAATAEPQRALLRSYLGKAFDNGGDTKRAARELDLAKELDSQDPTAWLYSALMKEQQNRVNEAIRDLEKSQDLNYGRSVERSRLLLDQDSAVRSANLARIYRDAGLTDWSVREAIKAVNTDYSSYSAHLFLANSYAEQRDIRTVNLRYETPAVSEYLVANLLAPVGAGILSPAISQREYSRLLERTGLGLVSSTEYFSRGDWIQSGAQFGTLGNVSYSVEGFYFHQNGQYPNNDLDQKSISAALKYQITPRDSAYFQIYRSEAESGDLTQYYNPYDPFYGVNKTLRVEETQEPIFLAGYQREWAPGSRTLFLFSRLHDNLEVENGQQPVLFVAQNGSSITATPYPGLPSTTLGYRSDFEAYSFELQHILKFTGPAIGGPGDHSVVGGGLCQFGWFDTLAQLGSARTLFANNARTSSVAFATSPQTAEFKPDFSRYSLYGYYNWQVEPRVLLSVGVSYDQLHHPLNFRYPPISGAEETTDQVSPKGGLTLHLTRDTTLRGAYTRSLGGVSFDQSFRLEPSQVAGFNQSWRTLIPESAAATTMGAEFETYGLALEHRFPFGLYFAVQADVLNSDASQAVGKYTVTGFPPVYGSDSATHERLDYTERSLTANLNQLLGDYFSVGVRYRVSEAELEDALAGIPSFNHAAFSREVQAVLHQVNLYTVFNHPSGAFARFESVWRRQSNQGYSPDLPGDDFWQLHAFAGWRFWQRRLEVGVGILNLTDQDYRLNPLNFMADLPRDRTFVASLRISF